MSYYHVPPKQGLYDPQFEKDSCGVGFVCSIDGRRSHDTIKRSLCVLKRLAHRGAVGADPETGDGAGILLQIPHEFYAGACGEQGIALPQKGHYGTGIVFLPTDNAERKYCKDVFAKIAHEEAQHLVGWRTIPVDNSGIGEGARATQPVIEQVFIGKNAGLKDELHFERRLYVIRKRIENEIRASSLRQRSFFYITNISSRTISYKGLLMPHQLESFFEDLKDERITSALSLVHSRYSTNTFPTWDLAQPFRFLAHNGEINTLRGNVNWMRAREGALRSDFFKGDIDTIKPIVVPGGSDSATLDNVFELLVLSGRSLEHAMTMLVPSAWGKFTLMDERLKAFFRYHACFMEPWDGPAAIAFTDGTRVGAVLDRNGLRPARYVVTKDGLAVMASEVGVLDIPPEDILSSARLKPGKMLFVDTERQMIVDDGELKENMAGLLPYRRWIRKHMVELDKLPAPRRSKRVRAPDILTQMKAFGYTREDLKMILKPMAQNGKEPVGSMGNDTPPAVLSRKNQLLYAYFKQLFAQVTNPAVDSIREDFVMSLRGFIGPQMNFLEDVAQHCKKLDVIEPVLRNGDLEKIRRLEKSGFTTKTISILFDTGDERTFTKTLDRICAEAEDAIRKEFSFIILSDRGITKEKGALPALLATGCVHHHLVQKALRTQIGIVVESAEPREVHHFALLFGYGADCVNPYLAYDIFRYMIDDAMLKLSFGEAEKNYRKAVHKGLLKIISKMGISTLRSYKGAQIFEALGLEESVIDKCFAGTVSRIGGAHFDDIAREAIARHREAFPEDERRDRLLTTGGAYQWMRDGEFHLWNPETVASLQDAVRKGDYGTYQRFAEQINEQSENPTTLRSLFAFTKRTAIPITEVEPEREIVKRFATGAMSFGSISRLAHETLAIAMNRLGGRSNTGEGGEDPMRFVALPNGNWKRSAIKQVASGRFGVVTNYLVNADELQIKIAQGAKPGEGGQLPGHKVSALIARTRYTTPGVTLISPPPHHDIYSIEDLAQLIFDLKNVNPRARISVKLVSEAGVGTVAAGVAKGHADMILISGGDGGTGASPLSSIRHAGLPWELGLSETHQTLLLNDLRSRVRLQTDGQMRTGRDVAIAACLGAEEYGFATAPLIAMGCVMLRHCHLNNCAVGVATQDEILERRFKGDADHVVNFFRFVARELREIMASLGMRTIDEMIGRTDLLGVKTDSMPPKAKRLDYSKILYKPDIPEGTGVYCRVRQDHPVEKILDRKLITLARPALERAEPVQCELPIHNTDRTTGAMLAGEVCRQYGEGALPPDTIRMKFRGVAGQSFGAWLVKGMTFELEGMANDYTGKGISGGKVIVYPDRNAAYVAEDNIVIGNTTFYGAISGEAYIRGIAGERFCIRNSGLHAVVEGVGDHGCEYMTGGRVVVLGKTGRNFAAGMSGGIAYVYDEDRNFAHRCNTDMVLLETVKKDDKEAIRALLHDHVLSTRSTKAKRVLDNFEREAKRFVKVMPVEYKRIIEGIATDKETDLTEMLDG